MHCSVPFDLTRCVGVSKDTYRVNATAVPKPMHRSEVEWLPREELETSPESSRQAKFTLNGASWQKLDLESLTASRITWILLPPTNTSLGCCLVKSSPRGVFEGVVSLGGTNYILTSSTYGPEFKHANHSKLRKEICIPRSIEGDGQLAMFPTKADGTCSSSYCGWLRNPFRST